MSLVYCLEDDDGIRELILCALKSGGYDAMGGCSWRQDPRILPSSE